MMAKPRRSQKKMSARRRNPPRIKPGRIRNQKRVKKRLGMGRSLRRVMVKVTRRRRRERRMMMARIKVRIRIRRIRLT